MSLSAVKSICKSTYSCCKMLQVQLPSISSCRYKSGIQKKIRHLKNGRTFDLPSSLFFQELQEESDFMNDLTPEHIKDQLEFRKLEMERMEKKNFFKSIENRHFREYRQKLRYEPNLLTWAMKEHLISLHQTDPEAWNVKNLSYAFPASLYAVSQILKTKLNPPSEEKRKMHDATVLENWKSLTKGKIGSIALLRKIISQRVVEVTEEKVPVVPGDQEKRLQDLIFTPTGDFYGEDDLSAPVSPTNHSWFKDIIEKYEQKLIDIKADNNNNNKRSKNNNKGSELQKRQNLDEIVTLYKLETDRTSTVKKSKNSKMKSNKKMTYEEFLKTKSNEVNKKV